MRRLAVRAGALAGAALLIGATAAQAIIVSQTVSPDTLPDGGGRATYTVTVFCTATTGVCTAEELTDSEFGPISEECREVLQYVQGGTTKSCSYNREIQASGPTTIDNTFAYQGFHADYSQDLYETAQSTVTILGPCERDETEPDECNEDPRDVEDPDDSDDSDDADDSDDPAEQEDDGRPDPDDEESVRPRADARAEGDDDDDSDDEEPTRPRGDASAEGDDTDHEDPDDD